MSTKDINKLKGVNVFEDKIPNLETKVEVLEDSFSKVLKNLFSAESYLDIKVGGFATEDIKGTPNRMARALIEMTRGYYDKPEEYLSLFDNPNKENPQLVVVNKTHFTSLCEHHLLPFSGYVSIGYVPNEKIAGLSKFGRVVDTFAHRLQLQEKLTKEIFDFLKEVLQPKELFVRIIGEHDCISCRGVNQKDSNTITIMKTDGISYDVINNVVKD